MPARWRWLPGAMAISPMRPASWRHGAPVRPRRPMPIRCRPRQVCSRRLRLPGWAVSPRNPQRGDHARWHAVRTGRGRASYGSEWHFAPVRRVRLARLVGRTARGRARFAMTGISPTLDRLKLAWRRSSAPAFFSWWGGELSALLPTGLRTRWLRGPEVLLLIVHPEGLAVRRERTGDVLAQIPRTLGSDEQRAAFARACAGIDPADRRLVLLLPAGSVLQRRLHLPQVAASDLLRVVGYEIDRQTP